MCGRFTLRTPAAQIARYFNVSAQREWQLPLRFNIAPTQETAIVRPTASGRELALARWGLIPSWSKDEKIGNRLINARSETAATQPAFRAAMRRRRCLVPADGFFEWRTEGRNKRPIYFRRPDEQPFAFAGLWERWHDIESCTILTTAANSLMKPLHERMPVILSPHDYDVWLDPSATDAAGLRYLFEPCPAEELIAYPVNPAANNSRYDAPDCIEPV